MPQPQQHHQHHEHDPNIRFVAQSLYDNVGQVQYPQYYRGQGYQSSMDMTRSHSINLITEEYLSGYMQDGRMSIVRRFFCLFVTFDLVFISLLWLICILITGDDIYDALKSQIVHYSIYTSVFDIVMAAICRFVVLILFYALLYINHWLIIAMSTTGSCLFLISKVFVYDWVAPKQPVFQVVLIVVSFVLAWGEAWFLDCRVIPQERHARHYFTAVTSDRSPLLAPFLSADINSQQQQQQQQPESVANFYSPYDTTHNSDDEDEQDEEYRKMGNECIRKAYELLQSGDWRPIKVTKTGDTIQSKQNEKVGKIYRLTARVKYPAKELLEELFYKVEEIPKWNPTLLESKVVRKIDTHTDVSYQATTGSGGGLVKSRDFVNLRCWRQCRNGQVIMESDDEDDDDYDPNNSYQPSTAEGSVSTISDNEYLQENHDSFVKKSTSELSCIDDKLRTKSVDSSNNVRSVFKTLSKSLGARDFQIQINNDTPPPLNDEYSDAIDNLEQNIIKNNSQIQQQQKNDVGGNPELSSEKFTDKIFISSALSIEYAPVPSNTKYIRGQNLVSCFAMREIEGKPDVCIFEWLLCLDLKGFIPRYVLEQAYTSFMQDYMTYLRKYCKELRQKRKKVPKINY